MNKQSTTYENLLEENQLLKEKISSLVFSETELKKNQEYWETVFNTLTHSICLIDTEGKVLLHNKATEFFTHKKHNEINGKYCYQVFHNTDEPHEKCPINEMKKSKKKECLVINSNGRFLKISIEPIYSKDHKYMGIVHLLEDVTAENIFENKLKFSEEKFHTAFQLCPIILSITNALDDKIIEINNAFCNITQYTKEEVYGKSSLQLKLWVNDSDRIKYINDLRRDGRVLNQEFPFRLKNNKVRYGLISGEFVTIHDELCIINVINDITKQKINEEIIKAQNEEIQSQNEEYKQINEELLIAKSEAVKSEKLKSAFLQNMSHEIRTPMNGIIGFSQLLLNSSLPENKKNHFVNIINANCQHLLGIINDIIDISKIESGEVDLHENTFSLNVILDEISNTFAASSALKNISLICKKGLDNESCIILGDETKIKQVLINLVNNALKFTENGFVEFGYHVNFSYIDFYVKDSGVGISKEDTKVIFERFRQVGNTSRSSRTGTGLGLAISKAYVEIMNGNIWVESEENKGSIFYFSIPYKPECNSINKTTSGQRSKFNFKDKTVLIVEDDDVNFIFLNEIIEETSAKVIRSVNGKEAILTCKNNSGIDLILMDLKMPELNGYQATEKIRVFNKTVPIIAQTAYAFVNDKEKSIAAGCNDYISKPVEVDVLLEKMNKFLKK